MKFIGKQEEMLELLDWNTDGQLLQKMNEQHTLQLIWFGKGKHHLRIDSVDYHFEANQMLFLTEFHQIHVMNSSEYRLLRFNRAFFCILDQDSEVGCKGLLFFGASQVPYIHLNESQRERFEALWNAFYAEMKTFDVLQLEMLQMMLKRFLILSTRLYKDQNKLQKWEGPSSDLVREFNYLVEKHFREKHSVAEYAELLFKSPKTLSNVFAKLSDRTPLQFIQDRIMLEAKRLLGYTDKAIKEIAYELGYDDVQSFSRFFRSQSGISPTEFRASADK